MAFDSTVMAAVAQELSQRLTGGRISKIYQPQADELALLIYAGGQNHRLVISANPRFARIHLSGVERKNPPAPPTFCMLMRKYAEGGRIMAVGQVGRERICRIAIGSIDELGNPVEYILVAEVMGKHSNIVLVGPNGRIVDAIRRVTEEVNRYRELLPGLPYIPPPPVGKLEPATLTAAALTGTITPPDPVAPAWQVLLDRVDGLGPLLAREAVCRSGYPAQAPFGAADPARLVEAVRALVGRGLPELEPCLLIDPRGRLKEFHVLPIRSWPGEAVTGFPSPSACADAYFSRRDEEERLQALRGSLAKLVRDEAGRVRRKLSLQAEALRGAEGADHYRVQGELITTNLWQIQKGDRLLRAVNYYDPDGAEVEIALDPSLTAAENAQLYYHRYQRARSGLAAIREQLELSGSELAYLEQVEAMLEEAASLPDLEEIRRELQAEGYLQERRAGRRERGDRREAAPTARGRKAAQHRKQGAQDREEKGAPPLTVISSDGLEIWVGRNNRQNDYLTLRLAAPTDLWFHTKEIPGSHVILRLPPGREVPERAIHEAAALAAWHSRGRESASVPVDYTQKKHVRKPSGARPGMVIYEHQKTLWVTPDPELNPILKGQTGGSEANAGTGSRGDRPGASAQD